MADIVEMFAAGGYWMYFVALAMFMGWIVGTVGLVVSWKLKKQMLTYIFGVVSLLIGLGIVAIGFVARYLGLRDVEIAVSYANPEHVEEMRIVGEQYAAYPLQFASIACVIPLLIGAVLLFKGTKQEPE